MAFSSRIRASLAFVASKSSGFFPGHETVVTVDKKKDVIQRKDMSMMIIRKVTWIVAVLLILTVTAGCGQPKTTPEEAALIFCNTVVKLDFTGAEKIGVSQEYQTQIAQARRQTLRNTATAILKANDLPPFSTNDLADVLEKMNRKIEIKTELVSKEQDSAVVKVSVRTIDGRKFTDEIISPAFNREDLNEKFVLPSKQADIFIQLFSKNLDKVSLVKEAKTFEMQLVLDKKTRCWLPANKNFKEPLIEAVNW